MNINASALLAQQILNGEYEQQKRITKEITIDIAKEILSCKTCRYATEIVAKKESIDGMAYFECNNALINTFFSDAIHHQFTPCDSFGCKFWEQNKT